MTSRPERNFLDPAADGGVEGVDEHGIDEQNIGDVGVGETIDASAFPKRPGAVAAGVDEILPDVVALTAERDEYLAALQRSQADFANYRKRVLRQQEDQATRAAVDLVAKILPVIDTLDLAVAHLEKEGHGVEPSTEAKVLGQARAQLVDALAKEGLARIDEVGVAFDPSVHDAVAHAPEGDDDSEEPGAKIEEVLRSGYRWRGQTLRPAMVRVRG
jgi:molecular chaperone GrpE